jgi:hypothetical protein
MWRLLRFFIFLVVFSFLSGVASNVFLKMTNKRTGLTYILIHINMEAV